MQRKVAEYEMTTSTGRDGYSKLVNRDGVVVIKENDFFGSEGSKEEGFSNVIIRVVDYWEEDGTDPFYKPPIS